jgi:hypothetical protein
VNEPVLIVRPDDGPIGLKHVALYVLLMIIIDVLDGNINTLFKIWNTSGQIKLSYKLVFMNIKYFLSINDCRIVLRDEN